MSDKPEPGTASFFEIDRDSHSLYFDGTPLKVEPQHVMVLEVLFDNSPNIVPRKTTLDIVWYSREIYVQDASLSQAITKLRNILEDYDPYQRVRLETFYKRGHRLEIDGGALCERASAKPMTKEGPSLISNASHLNNPPNDLELADSLPLMEATLQMPSMERKESSSLALTRQSLEITTVEATPAVRSPGPGTRPEDLTKRFMLSIDGVILNSAAELIFNTVADETIIKSRLIYKRAIEDFAFAVVYGSHLRSKWLPEGELPSSVLSHFTADAKLAREPAQGLIARLPSNLYSVDPADDAYRFGIALESEPGRARVREYITSFAQAVRIDGPKSLCKQWIAREADIYLGDHPNHFKESDNPSDFHFKKKYYESDLLLEVPTLLGDDILASLIGFLPISPEAGTIGRTSDRYSHSVLRQFALNNVLTLIAIMYEYEMSAEATSAHRLPSAIRAATKKQWNADHMHQRILRRLLVRSALNEALLESADPNDREALIDMLVWVRDQSPFVKVRSRLEDLDLLTMNPTQESELEAQKLIAEIKSLGRRKLRQVENLEVDSSAVIRDSDYESFPAPEPEAYFTRFYRFFPELASVSRGFNDSVRTPVDLGQHRSDRRFYAVAGKVRAA